MVLVGRLNEIPALMEMEWLVGWDGCVVGQRESKIFHDQVAFAQGCCIAHLSMSIRSRVDRPTGEAEMLLHAGKCSRVRYDDGAPPLSCG